MTIGPVQRETAALETSQLTDDESVEYGALVGALVGLGEGGPEGMQAGAEEGAAALILLEHRWAIPLREAIASSGGFPISDGFVHAQDLVAIGLLQADEAAELEAMTAAKAPH